MSTYQASGLSENTSAAGAMFNKSVSNLRLSPMDRPRLVFKHQNQQLYQSGRPPNTLQPPACALHSEPVTMAVQSRTPRSCVFLRDSICRLPRLQIPIIELSLHNQNKPTVRHYLQTLSFYSTAATSNAIQPKDHEVLLKKIAPGGI